MSRIEIDLSGPDDSESVERKLQRIVGNLDASTATLRALVAEMRRKYLPPEEPNSDNA